MQVTGPTNREARASRRGLPPLTGEYLLRSHYGRNVPIRSWNVAVGARVISSNVAAD